MKLPHPDYLTEIKKISSVLGKFKSCQEKHSDDGGFSKSRFKYKRQYASGKFEKIEPKYPICSFQTGGSLTFKGASSERRLFVETRPTGCLFSVALHKISHKYVQFPWRGDLYEFLCLCSGMDLLREFSQN